MYFSGAVEPDGHCNGSPMLLCEKRVFFGGGLKKVSACRVKGQIWWFSRAVESDGRCIMNAQNLCGKLLWLCSEGNTLIYMNVVIHVVDVFGREQVNRY